MAFPRTPSVSRCHHHHGIPTASVVFSVVLFLHHCFSLLQCCVLMLQCRDVPITVFPPPTLKPSHGPRGLPDATITYHGFPDGFPQCYFCTAVISSWHHFIQHYVSTFWCWHIFTAPPSDSAVGPAALFFYSPTLPQCRHFVPQCLCLHHHFIPSIETD